MRKGLYWLTWGVSGGRGVGSASAYTPDHRKMRATVPSGGRGDGLQAYVS
jgi:hypothetical protein